jgi:tetratricopeptide (TPR) repeat protein
MAGLLTVPGLWAIEVNEDGRALIMEAQQAYESDMRDRPVVTDASVHGYADTIVKSLVPKSKNLPAGVRLSTTILESPDPELYSYADGHVVMTMGFLYAMENEAQLAGVLAHEVANAVEGYYISMYQEIKANERAERAKAAAGALFGTLLDVAVDYAVDVEGIRQEEKLFRGEQTYGETMKRMAAVGAAQSTYYGIKDVIDNVPDKDENGQWLDPRMRFEVVADAQGMEYTALAGYEPAESAKGWQNLYRLKSEMIQERDRAMGQFAEQMRQMQGLMQINMQRMRQSLGATGLVQTRNDINPTRAEFVGTLVSLQEVQNAVAARKPTKGVAPYRKFLTGSLLPRAERAMKDEQYEKAHTAYKMLWNKGVKTAPVAYGMAKCRLGDFAFGASESEKEAAESAYLEAIKLDKRYALPYKGLGELYDDWERYDEAVTAYKNYLKLDPKAKDRNRIERKIKTLKRKAER